MKGLAIQTSCMAVCEWPETSHMKGLDLSWCVHDAAARWSILLHV